MATRLRCENGEWKTRDQFSSRQLANYDQQFRNGRATVNKTGIRCLEHASKHSVELKCNGPCNQTRELRLFSKSTRRNNQNVCVDCTDYRLKMEIGENLPPPGAQLSVDELAPRLPHPAYLRDDLVFEEVAANFVKAHDDDGGVSDSMSTLSLSQEQSTGGESVGDEEPITYGNRLDRLIPQHLRPRHTARAPHWLIPDFGESSPAISLTASVDETSTAGSVTTGTAEPAARGLGEPVSHNAWGPNGEFAHMTKTPTVASGSTAASTRGRAHRGPQTKGNKGWAKVPSRKQPPQLPDYLKYNVPVARDDGQDSDGLDIESNDGITYH
ncbi:hypothetical protein N658DRAFT_447346 [Parathielavia hyrcaniae]|uniref:Stc1 domain-containing protein n=1 Tax=Parathielavia hyrcaniae TaxID=113614 RepID=A0AAN6T3A7_9PEZI|nr:hypothetical protein N658DRAFT_447346 [Parathielavia hyrcaniae]